MTVPLLDGGVLAALPRRGRVITRQISPENPTGGRGAGAMAEPDPSDPSLPHSRMAEHLGRGFKVRPFISIAPKSTAVLAELPCAGVITNIAITSNVRDLRALRLRISWDGADAPAVDVELANFFCLGGPGYAHTVNSVPIVVGPTRGCMSLWRMPFADGARVTLENQGDELVDVVAYKVTWEERAKDAVEASRFHARTVSGGADPGTSEFAMADIAGAGLLTGISLNWRAETMRWWGEGEVKFYLGADEYPTLVDTGTEDYFGGAWGFGRDSTFVPGGPLGERSFSGPYAGVPFQQTNEGYPREIVLYRWHLHDPIGFDDGIRAVVQALGQGPGDRYEVRSGDTLTATAIWYADGA